MTVEPAADALGHPTTVSAAAESRRQGAPDVAVVGLSARFPGARSAAQFWDNLRRGVESITFFPATNHSEVSGPATHTQVQYVPAKGYLEGWDEFDGEFFGYSASEADIMDPQLRLLHECLWEAFEDAGYAPDSGLGRVGVYIGGNTSPQWYTASVRGRRTAEIYHAVALNDSHGLSTRLSYKFGLRGPAITLQTACSSSLVAVHLACRALSSGDCDMAVAGGVSLMFPAAAGYHHEPGMVTSPDGHCRTFDRHAQGTLPGDGCGLIVLKPLRSAQADGDRIYAVVRGIAVNNDGRDRLGYTAPSVSGQSDVIRRAHEAAGISPETIGFAEAHGTATPLGDPVEIEALTQAFGSAQRQFCAIGSVKSNIGHLNHAAGIAGFIKSVLALHHRALPPTLHFNEANPEIDFGASPFYVNTALMPWETPLPRRACVSSFGIGGTNAHAILEEHGVSERPESAGRQWHLLPISAKGPEALEDVAQRLRQHLGSTADSLGDVAFTLQTGRSAMRHRRVVICRDPVEAIDGLARRHAEGYREGTAHTKSPRLAYLLPGQGAQYPGMCAGLYATRPAYRRAVDRCMRAVPDHLRHWLGVALGLQQGTDDERREIHETAVAQPALFICEYALAMLLESLHLAPAALLGHSVGELVAACLSGVFRPDDALRLVVRRGELMQALPRGLMMSVAASATVVEPLLAAGVGLAVINAPERCVVSGPESAIRELASRLAAAAIDTRDLPTSHAFHSPMMEPVMTAFESVVADVPRCRPSVPFLSNVSGSWITPEEAINPAYWAGQLRQTVRFDDCLQVLLGTTDLGLVAVGPGHALSALALAHPRRPASMGVFRLTRRPDESADDDAQLLRGLGEMWVRGIDLRWAGLHDTRRMRVHLPTYPFARTRHPDITVAETVAPRTGGATTPARTPSFSIPLWQRARPVSGETVSASARLLLFVSALSGDALAHHYRARGYRVTVVVPGTRFEARGNARYAIRPSAPAHYRQLLAALDAENDGPTHIVHAWSLMMRKSRNSDRRAIDRCLALGFHSVSALAQALAEHAHAGRDVRLRVLTANALDAPGTTHVAPAQAPVIGLCLAVDQEYPHVHCVAGDVSADELRHDGETAILHQPIDDLLAGDLEPGVAWRARARWTAQLMPLQRPPAATARHSSISGQVYVVVVGDDEAGWQLADGLLGAGAAVAVIASPSAAQRGADHSLENSARYLGVAAEFTDAAAIRRAIDAVRSRWARIDALVYWASASGRTPAAPVDTLERDACDDHLRAAFDLTMLRDALDDDLPFVFLMSSTAWRSGRRGVALDAAVSRFQHACARAWTATSATRWVAVECDPWLGGPTTDATTLVGEPTLTVAQGIEACLQILSSAGFSHVVVSAGGMASPYETGASETPATDSSAVLQPATAGGELEATLSEVWRTFFGARQVSPTDNFYALGGESLTAVALASRLSSTLAMNVHVSDVLTAPTIAQLADLLRAKQRRDRRPVVVRARPRPQYPLSFAQQAILAPRNQTYPTRFNCPLAFDIEEAVDATRLTSAFEQLIARHEILRTSIDVNRGLQRVAPHLRFTLPVACCDDLQAQQRASALVRPFVLDTAPLLRAELLRLPGERTRLLLDVHHAVTDGVSLAVMMSELWALYRGDALPPVDLHYRDYALWQEEITRTAAFREDQEFWERTLDDFAWTALPPTAGRTGTRFGNCALALEPHERDEILACCHRAQVTPMTLLLAAISATLCRYTGQRDLTIGLRVSRRADAALERMLGPFVEDLAYRVTLPDPSDVPAAVARTRTTLNAVLDHSTYPYEALNEGVQRHRPTDNGDLFSILVNYLPPIDVTTPAVRATLAVVAKPADTKYHVNLRVRDAGDRLGLDAKFRADRYSHELMATFLRDVLSAARRFSDSVAA